ncbi:MAG: choice-of-anchor V domain-containing protein [Vicinamibacterales bacterium]
MIVPIVLGIAATVALTVVAGRSPAAGDPFHSLLKPAASHRYADGAPPGFSGGFDEQSCDACHFHAAPNAGPGKLTIEGVPDRFTAGQAYRITIALSQPAMKLAGFQLTVRFKDDGAQAGMLAKESDTDARVGIDAQSPVHYAGQRREGAALSAQDESRWTVIWTAPSSTRSVMFHVAANGANGDERADGDYVYTLARELQPPAASPKPQTAISDASSSSDPAWSASSSGNRPRPDTPWRAR